MPSTTAAPSDCRNINEEVFLGAENAGDVDFVPAGGKEGLTDERAFAADHPAPIQHIHSRSNLLRVHPVADGVEGLKLAQLLLVIARALPLLAFCRRIACVVGHVMHTLVVPSVLHVVLRFGTHVRLQGSRRGLLALESNMRVRSEGVRKGEQESGNLQCLLSVWIGGAHGLLFLSP